MRKQNWKIIGTAASAAVLLAAASATRETTYDVILRHGTILDGTGARRYVADIAVSGDRIARIGDLSGAHAAVDIDVKGLLVAPGFINIHSHATPAGMTTAANMLTQGVTTEILNPDGGGPLDLAQQRSTLRNAGLAVNIGTYIGFNSVWSAVVGATDRRPTPADIDSMQKLVVRGLENGAFGVSAGLDYKPAYFSTIDEAVAVLEPARKWRTNFPNHDRLAPESGYSSRTGMGETMEISVRTGMVPEFTHMKVQGHEQGTAPAVLEWMRKSTAEGHYVAADVYPYLAGQTSLVQLIIPGWAQDGGREKMLARFKDPEQRARIIKEADEALTARFDGAKGVYLFQTNRELTDVMKEKGLTSPGATVVAILEESSPGAILRFGAESDVIELLKAPGISVACDCGSSAPPVAGRPAAGHPRNYGTFTRVLGHYVRETHVLTWENAIRKMSGLPASTVGLVDRGFLVPGMHADITVFDSATVIDHATYEKPTELSEGIRFVFVNGKEELKDGVPTGEKGGQAMERSGHMPTRPLLENVARKVAAHGIVATAGGAVQLTLNVSQPAGTRHPIGTVKIVDLQNKITITGTVLGIIQTADGWASVTGRATVGADGLDKAFTVIVERADPLANGTETAVMDVEGTPLMAGPLTPGQVTVTGGKQTPPARAPRK